MPGFSRQHVSNGIEKLSVSSSILQRLSHINCFLIFDIVLMHLIKGHQSCSSDHTIQVSTQLYWKCIQVWLHLSSNYFGGLREDVVRLMLWSLELLDRVVFRHDSILFLASSFDIDSCRPAATVGVLCKRAFKWPSVMVLALVGGFLASIVAAIIVVS
jgi:hypothetical protein